MPAEELGYEVLALERAQEAEMVKEAREAMRRTRCWGCVLLVLLRRR